MFDIHFIEGCLFTWVIIFAWMACKTFLAWYRRKKVVSEIVNKLKQDGIYTDPDGNEWRVTDTQEVK